MQVKANNGKTYTLPSKQKWRKGPPPSIGWWPASVQGFATSIRWWDGSHWSAPIGPQSSSRTAGIIAGYKEVKAKAHIEWTERWWKKTPAEARVKIGP